MNIDLKFVFFISFILAVVLFYYISSKHLSKNKRDENLEIFNFIIPIIGIFIIITAFLTYFETTDQARNQRELQFAINNENRLQNMINDLSSCVSNNSDFCSSLFKTQDQAFSFYIITTLENSLIQKKFKATTEYDNAWLNKIRKFMKENDFIIEYWQENNEYFNSLTNEWINIEIKNNFKPVFFPDQ